MEGALLFGSLEAADEGFVDFDDPAAFTEYAGVVRPHRLANAPRHEPCCLESDAQDAVELVARNALLAAGNKIHCLKPYIHGDVRGFEDGADFYRERLAALVTLVGANAGAFAVHLRNTIYAATMTANRTIRPQALFDEGIRCLFVMEMRC
jgi:homoserine dehydrogenase